MAVRQGAVEDVVTASVEFWTGKRVLLTGHTGFKGAWLALWLRKLGAQVTGLALTPEEGRPNLYRAARVGEDIDSRYCDIRDAAATAAQVRDARPQVLLHLAAQALVRPGYRDPLGTFAANTMGTAHVLDALRGLDGVRAVVCITTDKVYRNQEWPHPYRESDPLGGHDPYSASKAAAELVAASYRDAFLGEQGVALATARAGNVIGGGDWAEDRLLPDAVRAWQAGRPIQVRRPNAVRPWQHVLEPLAAYLELAQALWRDPAKADAYNFGPPANEAANVRTVIELARRTFGQGDVEYGDGREGPHEAGLLALDSARAQYALGVRPRRTLAQSVEATMRWYRDFQDGADARALCEAQIEKFAGCVPDGTIQE